MTYGDDPRSTYRARRWHHLGRLTRLAACFVLLGAGCSWSRPPDGKLPTRRVQRVLHKLDNGLKVLIQENHSAPVVAIQLWVDAGSADDSDARSGIAHVMEHMVFKGTTHRSEGQIAREIEGAGGQINAWTSFDQTVFHIVIASRYFDRGLDILADAGQNPRIDQRSLERELQVIQEEIKQGEDTPSRVVARNLFRTAYQKHPYGRPVIGRTETVAALDRGAVRAFFDSWYRPSNMTLVVVGDVDTRSALRRISKLFGTSPRRARAVAARPEEPPQRRTRVVVRGRELKEAYVTMAFHIPGLKHADIPALDLLAVILGQGETSRLTRRLRHELQVVTTAYAYAYTPRDPGLLVLGATATPDKMLTVVQALAREAALLGTSGVTVTELQRGKMLIDSDAVYQKETVQGQARKLGYYQTVGGSLEFEEEYHRAVNAATGDRVREVAAKYLRLSNLSVSVLTPQASAAKQERALREAVIGALHDARDEVAAMQRLESQEEQGTIATKLPNGARLLVRRDPSVPLVALRAVWLGGQRYETERNAGINSLLSGLVTRGTTSRSADEINDAIEGLGGSIGGFSGQNSFGLRAEVLARQWEQGFEIFADCILNPAFANNEVERERQALLDDILAQEDNLSSVALRLFNRTFFKKHPYRFDQLGQVSSVTAISRSDLAQYYGRHYHPSGMVMAVVGDVDPDQVKARVLRLFDARRPKRPVEVKVPQEPRRESPEEAIELVNKEQAHIVVGYPGASLRSKDRFPLEVLAQVLSGQGGRLFRELRDRQGLAYHVTAFSHEGLDPGYFAVYMATGPARLQEALGGIAAELEKVRAKEVPAAEVSRAKRHLVGSFEISLQRKSTVAAYLGFHERYGLGHRAYLDYPPSILAVTPADVRRVARKYLDPRKRVVAVVKPEELSPGAAGQLGGDRRAGVIRGTDPAPKKPTAGRKAKGQRKRSGRSGRSPK